MTAEAPIPARKVVLVVEDHVDMLELYAASLRQAGFFVIEAETIAAARDAVHGPCPDLVVLDCSLPDGDGLALLQTWREGSTGLAKVPVIVLTGSAECQDVEAALLAGADQFVPKPGPSNVHTLHVTRALDGTRPSARLRRVTP